MTTSVEGRNPVPRYQTIDDEFFDPRNKDAINARRRAAAKKKRENSK